MKKLAIVVFMFSATLVLGQSQQPEKLKKFKFEWVKVKLPNNFVEMEDEAFFRTTASAVKPEIAYRDPSGQVTFTINNSVNRWGSNLFLLKDFQKATIMSMHQKVEFTRDEVVEIKKRTYAILAFDSKIDDLSTPDGKKRVIKHYNYMMYTVKDGYLVTISLRIPNWMKEEGWAAAADDIISSIRIK